MKTRKTFFYGIIAVILMAALAFTACKKDPEDEDLPENWPPEKRWSTWQDPAGSTAKLDSFSVDKDGVVTVKISGVAEPQEEDNWYAYKVRADYAYTSKANASYTYKIQLWKGADASNGVVSVLYYEDNETYTYLDDTFTPTTTQTTYTIHGKKLPGKQDYIAFQCANMIGTIYLKVISIKENANNDGDEDNWTDGPGKDGPGDNWPPSEWPTDGGDTGPIGGGDTGDDNDNG